MPRRPRANRPGCARATVCGVASQAASSTGIGTGVGCELGAQIELAAHPPGFVVHVLADGAVISYMRFLAERAAPRRLRTEMSPNRSRQADSGYGKSDRAGRRSPTREIDSALIIQK